MGLKELIVKYSQPGPRYTSYPTAPQWSDAIGESHYRKHLERFRDEDKALSLYAHIPFCETLCYYCGCNIVITKNHESGKNYVGYLSKELSLIAKELGEGKTQENLLLHGVSGLDSQGNGSDEAQCAQ